MKNKHLKWLGTGFLLALLIIVGIAAVPAFQDFNTNQFGTSGNKVSIKSGVLLTNAFNNGVAIGSGGGVTFSDLVWTNYGGIVKPNGTPNTVTGNVQRVSLTDNGAISISYGSLVGGTGNILENGADFSSINGGSLNRVTTNASSGFIGGGTDNLISSGSYGGIIGGNHCATYGDPNNFIAGSSLTTIGPNSGWSVILGGDDCSINGKVGSDYMALLPGFRNGIKANAQVFSYVIGGQFNTNSADDTWTFGENLHNTVAQQFEFGFADARKTTLSDTNVHIRVDLLIDGLLQLTGTTNQITFGGTNSPPANASTVRKWISVRVVGETNAYRLPLYE